MSRQSRALAFKRPLGPPVNIHRMHALHGLEPSVLADFDTGRVLDELSFGVMILDRQLCAIYANVTAQTLLGMQLPGMRGRPLADFLAQPQHFGCAVGRALTSGEGAGCSIRVAPENGPEKAGSIALRIVPLCSETTAGYLLVELTPGGESV